MSHLSYDHTPSWRPFAWELIERLRRQESDELNARTGKKSPVVAELEELFEQIEDSTGTDGSATAVTDDPVQIPARKLLHAIRLAAAFGSAKAAQSALQCGAMIVLRNTPIDELDDVKSALQSCFPRAEWRVLSPDIYEGAVSKTGQQKFERHLATAVDSIRPTLILLPDGAPLPDYISAMGIPMLRFPPICADVLITGLMAGHLSDQITDEQALRRALPDDRLLARMTTVSTCAAMNAPDLHTAIKRLLALTKTWGANGPRLEDMRSNGPALITARRVVADLVLWKQGEVPWTDLSRSLLFHGLPGTGKTWLARAMGNSAGINVITATFGEWQSHGHLGDMLREMRKSFAEARRIAPCILVIDEIDAVGSRSSGERQNSNYRANVIAGFLTEMDRIAREEGVIVVGTCNHIDQIDPAILRAGRFDFRIEVPMPDADALLAILRQNLKEDIADHQLRDLARLAVGRSPAEIDAAIRAARSNARHSRKLLNIDLLREQLNLVSRKEHSGRLWRIAVHEAGHAVIGRALGLGMIDSMLINDDGGQIRRESYFSESLLSDIEAEICYSLGGRAAERLVLGTVSAGSGGPVGSDLAKATEHALGIEISYGLGPEGPVWLRDPAAAMQQDSILRARIRQRIEREERRAGEVLEQHREVLEALARDLVAMRSMNSVQIWKHLHRISGPEVPLGMEAGEPDHRLAQTM